MLARQKRRVEFTGGLEALALQDYQVDLLAALSPRPSMFFAYGPGDALETLEHAAKRLFAAGFSPAHASCESTCSSATPKDTLARAEQRLRQILALGFTPMACSGAPKRRRKKNGAQTNTGAPSSAGGLAPPSYTPV